MTPALFLPTVAKTFLVALSAIKGVRSNVQNAKTDLLPLRISISASHATLLTA